MLNKLIDWSVTNRLLVVLGLVALLGAAILLIPQLNLDAFPDVTNVQVTINTEARGLAAACEAIGRNPGAVGPIRITMIIGLALIESLVIYALIIAFLILA